MLYSIIDIGADCIRLSIYKTVNEKIKLILSNKTSVGLIGYVESDMLTQKGIHQTCTVLNCYSGILDCFGIEHTYAFAADALSCITNITGVVQQIRDNTGYRVELLSGEQEARLSYFGAAQTMVMGTGLFVDIGGGSTQLVTLENGNILTVLSIPFGSLSLTLKYVKGITTHKTNILVIKKVLKNELKRTYEHSSDAENLYVTGGTAEAARKLYNDIYNLPYDNNVMEFDAYAKIITKYNEERRDVISRIKQLVPERIHTIIPGMVALYTIAWFCGCQTIHVCEFGVREGYLSTRLLQNGE